MAGLSHFEPILSKNDIFGLSDWTTDPIPLKAASFISKSMGHDPKTVGALFRHIVERDILLFSFSLALSFLPFIFVLYALMICFSPFMKEGRGRKS